VARILLRKKQELYRKLGYRLSLKRIADIDVRRKRGISIPKGVLVNDAGVILNDPEIDIVVELIGGMRPAKDFILKAIRSGKHVVTANKALLAISGQEIFSAAAKAEVEVGLEAAVAGSIPIIKVIRESLVGNRIHSLYGIINGTSNYILSKMTEEGVDFSEALKEAKRLGYAEADPTFDIEGTDSAHKLAILLSLSFGAPFLFRKVYTEGITRITSLDIQFASEFGYTIKLLAIAKILNGSIEARVHPTMLPREALISRVNGVYNAVYVEGDAAGRSLYYGRGAGEMPTGSAVVSDIVDISRSIIGDGAPRFSGLGVPGRTDLTIMSMEDLSTSYYLRFGVLSKISGVLGNHNISIKSVIQKERKKKRAVPLVMMTHRAREKDIVRALKAIGKLSVVSGRTAYIRVEAEDE
jgi:homoserine dehydrogenase